jgi:hypothetical protein
MIFKIFVVMQLRNAERIRDQLFYSPALTGVAFKNATPSPLQDEPERMCTTGFAHPEMIDIETACDPLAPTNDRIYRLTHIRREKKVDAEGIHKKCVSEDHGDATQDEIEQESIRRISEAMAMAPIKETRTPLFLRSDGTLVIGAGLSAARDIASDLINAFEVADEEPFFKGERWVTVETCAARFNNRYFHQRCEVLLDRDVFGDDDDPYDMPGTVCFNNEFVAKLPEKASIAVKNVGILPVAIRPTLNHAEYHAMGITVFTNQCEYELRVTNLGEYKSVSVVSEIDDEADRFWLNEMLSIHETVAGAMAAPVEVGD